MTAPDFDDLRNGDFVKVRVAGERLWFRVIALSCPFGIPARGFNAVLCVLDSKPRDDVHFDGRVTIDREWVIETARPEEKGSHLRLVS